MEFDSQKTQIVSATDSAVKVVSTTVQVTSSQAGEYSWLVSNKDLGDTLTSDQFKAYVEECNNYGNTADSERKIIQLINQGTAIEANTLTNVPVSFQIDSNATGTYYIYLIVWANNRNYCPAKGNVHCIQIVDGVLATSTADPGNTNQESTGADQTTVDSTEN